ncbi:hypothetical protein J6590_066895 [Homalodisca vitripennis]|nr:hypothetical protein J6590_066895 [Homalodisca vitripennis]
MAASTGGESMEEKPTVENASKLPNSLQQSAEKPEDVSTNGTPFGPARKRRKGINILRPPMFNPDTASGSSPPIFGSDTSTPQFNVIKSPLLGTSPSQSSIFNRPSVFGSFGDSEKGSLGKLIL